MTRKTGWQNFYVPENYEDALAELKDKLSESGFSFSNEIRSCLRQLFKKHGVSFTDKVK